MTFLPLDHIWHDARFDVSRTIEFDGDPKSYTPVIEGDLVVPKVAPTFAHGRVALACDLVGNRALATSEVFVVRTANRMDARFLRYRLQASDFVTEGVASWTGVAGLKRISADFVRNVRISPLAWKARSSIADFLDTETARIDDVIGFRTRLSNLVSERSRATIDDALSMASRLRLKIGLKARPDYGAVESSIEGDVAWPRFIRITDIDDHGRLRGDDVKRLPPEVALPFMLDNGDILVARSGATVGKAFHFRSELHGDACFAGYLIRLRCDPSRLLPEYLALITQSGGWWRQVDEAIQQATIQNVSASRYADFVVPVPSVPAQRSVLARLTPLLLDHANVGAAVNRQINLLRERRQALITAAVTGKLQAPGTTPANAAA